METERIENWQVPSRPGDAAEAGFEQTAKPEFQAEIALRVHWRQARRRAHKTEQSQGNRELTESFALSYVVVTLLAEPPTRSAHSIDRNDRETLLAT
jgi:hypothetical protein